MTDQPTPLRLTPTPPDDNDRAWLNHAREEEQKAPARFEEAAKFLAGIVSVSLTIFIDKRPVNLAPWTNATLTFAAVLWMLAVVFALAVMFPMPYRYRDDSPDDIRRAHRKSALVKKRLLLGATLLFLAALGTGVFAFTRGWQSPTPAATPNTNLSTPAQNGQ